MSLFISLGVGTHHGAPSRAPTRAPQGPPGAACYPQVAQTHTQLPTYPFRLRWRRVGRGTHKDRHYTAYIHPPAHTHTHSRERCPGKEAATLRSQQINTHTDSPNVVHYNTSDHERFMRFCVYVHCIWHHPDRWVSR